MKSFLRASVGPAALFVLLGTAASGCGGDDSTVVPDEDTGTIVDDSAATDTEQPDTTTDDTGSTEDSTVAETTAETSVMDSGTPDALDTSVVPDADAALMDTAIVDTAVAETIVDTALPVDAADVAVADAADAVVDSAPADTACVVTPGTLHVAPTGSDTAGNGSVGCPFKTIKKAIDTAGSAATTIMLAKAASGVATYGTGCTGGAPCDTTPLLVTSALTIEGAGAAADVVVTGDGSSVFGVTVAGATFNALTIRPTKTGTANTGGHGIVFDYAAAGAGGAIRNTVIEGTLATATIAGTGSAVVLKGAATETIGTNVVLRQGFHGVLIQGTAKATLSGAAMAQTVVSNFGGACVYVDGTAAGANPVLATGSLGTTNDVVVRDCGGAGAIVLDTLAAGTASTLSRTAITKSLTGGTYPGLVLRGKSVATLADSSISGLTGDGILVTGPATGTVGGKLTITAGVTSSNNTGNGLDVTTLGTASINGLTARSNGANGVHCDSNTSDPTTSRTIKVRNTVLLQNTNNGIFITGNCAADLGADGDPANNVFNTVDQKNTLSGLCINSGAVTVTVTNTTWSCGPTTTACTVGNPTKTTLPGAGMFTCSTSDITVKSTTLNTPPPQTCCKTYP